MHAVLAILALVITILYFLVESASKDKGGWGVSKKSVKKKQSGHEKIRQNDVKVTRKTGKTVYSRGWSSGVLALHDNGKITVNASFKHLIHDLEYRRYGDYYSIQNPTEKDKQAILDRLYSK